MPTKEEVFETLKYHVEVDVYDTRRYYNSAGQLHRTDGPAVIRADGTKEWWQNDLRHREDGPAIVHTSGSMEWWQNGKLHREDGPAYETIYGVKEWFLSGVEYTEQEFTAVRQARGYDAD